MEYKILYDKEMLENERKRIDFEYNATKKETVIKLLCLLVLWVVSFITIIDCNLTPVLFPLFGIVLGWLMGKTFANLVVTAKEKRIGGLEVINQLESLLDHEILDVHVLDICVTVTIESHKYADCDSETLGFYNIKENRVTASLVPTRVDFFSDQAVIY